MAGVDPREEAEDAWAAADEVLDGDVFDAEARAVLEVAAGHLRERTDEESRERYADVLGGLLACFVAAGDGDGVAATVSELLWEAWPEGSLSTCLFATISAARSGLLTVGQKANVCDRAIEVAGDPEDPHCRTLLAEVLKDRADVALSMDDVPMARAILERVARELAEEDVLGQPAAEQLVDPRFLGRELLDRPGRLRDAEAAFRLAIEQGHEEEWFELASVLGLQPGREDEERRALERALDTQDDPERMSDAGLRLGRLLLYGLGEREAARRALGRASLGRGDGSIWAIKELANIAVLDGDHVARRQLVSELVGRALEEHDPDARRKSRPVVASITRVTYARPFIAVYAWRWRRGRRRMQRRYR